MPIEDGDSGNTAPVLFGDVHSAFNRYLAGDSVTYELACTECQSHQYHKEFHAVAFPQVLVLILNRYKSVERSPGVVDGPYSINHPVATTEV